MSVKQLHQEYVSLDDAPWQSAGEPLGNLKCLNPAQSLQKLQAIPPKLHWFQLLELPLRSQFRVG